MYNRVLVEFRFNPENLPKFKSQAEVDAWHKSIGRLVAYSMDLGIPEEHDLSNPLDEMRLVELVQANENEILSVHHAPVKEYMPSPLGGDGFWPSDASNCVNETLDTLRRPEGKQPFVMAAINHGDGQYGFHS